MENFSWNPAVIVPLGAFLVAIVGIVSGAVSNAHSRRLKAEQRMALLARGVPVPEIERILDGDHEVTDKVPSSPSRRIGNSRRTAMVLIFTGLGIVFFGFALAAIQRERDVLSVSACGLVPLLIGVGFLVDYKLQRNELERFSVALESEKSLR